MSVRRISDIRLINIQCSGPSETFLLREDDSIASAFFGAIQGVVGCFHEEVGAVPVFGERGDADRECDCPKQLPAVLHIQLFDLFS